VSRAVLLLVGQITLFALVHILKDAFDRPRPARPLTAADLSAFPSGHATYVVTWVAVAILLTRAMPTVASRFGFVLVSIAIAAVVGATRVYLRVHYPSDVFGGLALGTMVYAILALALVVVGYVRENAHLARAS
jgi:undecaprenyl-diphosphatase